MVYDFLPDTHKSKDKQWMTAAMNRYAQAARPFFFMIDFKKTAFLAIPLSEISPNLILYNINGLSNSSPSRMRKSPAIRLEKKPLPFADYLLKFNKVKAEIKKGNSYLLNLTCPSPVEISHSLEEIYHRSQASYKLYIRDCLLVFSPEPFIRIEDGIIRTHPMKGTIDASIPDAEKIILSDPKETAEHFTIVDLLRNDLSMVATDVQVDRFRYIERIASNNKPLLQVSSSISGRLPVNYLDQIGEIVLSLLPAGSVSGAPKDKTLQIIEEVEDYDRGFYTGIMGVFDGKKLDCGVMIRYIERGENGLVFKSGGGITWDSNAESEYQELKDKVYVPAV